MKTEKLFYENACIRSFRARVLSCEKADDGWAVVLDRTAFFPEGGGQSADTGTLGGARVFHVREKNGTVIHFTDAALAPGTEAEGEIDWADRFRKMQTHTGEHIVSGLARSLWGLTNVGFHLGADGCTLDLDRDLTPDQITALEDAANRVVWEDRPVTARFPTPEELRRLDYRSKLDLTEDVRIVTIEGVDDCACCALHVASTGQIGLIRVADHMRHRGGVRLWLKAGADALEDYRRRCAADGAVSALLNVPQADIAAGTARLVRERDELKAKLAALRRASFEARAAAIEPAPGDLLLFVDDADEADMRLLANAGMEKCGGVCAVFSGSEGAWRFVMASRVRDMRELTGLLRERLGARGGGKPPMISGQCPAPRREIEEFFRALRLN